MENRRERGNNTTTTTAAASSAPGGGISSDCDSKNGKNDGGDVGTGETGFSGPTGTATVASPAAAARTMAVLDPILQLLLATIQEYHREQQQQQQQLLHQRSGGEGRETSSGAAKNRPRPARSGQQQRYQQRILELLRAQTDLVAELRRAVVRTSLCGEQQGGGSPSVQVDDDDGDDHSRTGSDDDGDLACLRGGELRQQHRMMMTRYYLNIVSFPLLAIIKGTGLDWENASSRDVGSDEQSNEEFDLVLRSSKWKAVASASRAYAFLVNDVVPLQLPPQMQEPLPPPTIAPTPAPRPTQAEDNDAMVNTALVRALTACAAALPSGPEVRDKVDEDDTGSRASSSHLDRGEDCLCALLDTVASLMAFAGRVKAPSFDCDANNKRNNNNNSSFAVTVSQTLDGALVARIADCCVSILRPPEDGSNKYSNKTTTGSTSISSSPRPFSTDVQTRANDALQSLINGVPLSLTWQMAFPGCFAGLYRCVLVSVSGRGGACTTDQRKPAELVSSTLRTLTLLLKTCLPSRCRMEAAETEGSGGSKKSAVMNRLAALAVRANEERCKKRTQLSIPSASGKANVSGSDEKEENGGSSNDGNSSSSNLETKFLEQFRVRVPAPLLLLVRLLASSSSPKIRSEAASLYSILLLDARDDCWSNIRSSSQEAEEARSDGNSGTENLAGGFKMAVLESCLTLTDDPDSDVAAVSRELLVRCLSEDHSNTIALLINRATDLMLELPTLARRQRKVELRTKLRLLTALLSLLSPTEQRQRKRINKSFLQSMFSTCSTADEIRRAWTSALDVDFSEARTVAVLAMLDDNGEHATRPNGLKLRYMDDEETSDAASNCLRKLGKALGPKHAALVVDATVADLYEACVTRIEEGGHQALIGPGQIEWLHEWMGSLIFAKDVLVGAFAPLDADRKKDQKKERKRSLILTSLAASVLSIITSNTLIDLPCSQIQPQTTGALGTNYFSSHLRLESLSSNSTALSSSAALRGNAAVSFLILDFVGVFFDLLGGESARFVPLCLYQILEKASSAGCFTSTGSAIFQSVQQMGFYALSRLSTACHYDRISDLVAGHLDQLVSNMLGRIRVPGGRALTAGNSLTDEVQVVAAVTVFILRIVAQGLRDLRVPHSSGDLRSSPARLAGIQDFVLELTAHFDRHSSMLTNDTGKALLLLELYEAALLCLLASYGISSSTNVVASLVPVVKTDQEPWFDLLRPFQKDPADELTPKEGFEAHSKRSNPENQAGSVENQNYDYETLNRGTIFVARILSRCSYLLSHPSSLKVQIQSCDVLIYGFTFLGWIASEIPKREDESNGPTTAVLRQVHDTWSAISSRIKATTDAVVGPDVRPATSSLLIVSTPTASSNTTGVAQQRIFLSKMLTLASMMAVCAGDFMTRPLRESVWPCIGRLVGSFVGSGSNDRKNGTRDSRPRLLATDVSLNALTTPTGRFFNTNTKYSASQKYLLQGTLSCLARVYGHPEVGMALSSHIPATGTMLFPFLECDDEDSGCHDSSSYRNNNPSASSIGKICFVALQNMLRIDSDALWRPLVELSGQYELPPCPLLMDRRSIVSGTVVRSSSHCTEENRLAVAARELIDFIESLPEQPID